MLLFTQKRKQQQRDLLLGKVLAIAFFAISSAIVISAVKFNQMCLNTCCYLLYSNNRGWCRQNEMKKDLKEVLMYCESKVLEEIHYMLDAQRFRVVYHGLSHALVTCIFRYTQVKSGMFRGISRGSVA